MDADLYKNLHVARAMLTRAARTHPRLAQTWARYLDQGVAAAESRAFECMSAVERMDGGVADYSAETLAAACLAYAPGP